jgi:hypothetical protein
VSPLLEQLLHGALEALEDLKLVRWALTDREPGEPETDEDGKPIVRHAGIAESLVGIRSSLRSIGSATRAIAQALEREGLDPVSRALGPPAPSPELLSEGEVLELGDLERLESEVERLTELAERRGAALELARDRAEWLAAEVFHGGEDEIRGQARRLAEDIERIQAAEAMALRRETITPEGETKGGDGETGPGA